MADAEAAARTDGMNGARAARAARLHRLPMADSTRACLMLVAIHISVVRAQSYGYSYSYSYSYGSKPRTETYCNDTAVGDSRGGANCEDRWAVLYPAEVTDSTGHSC